MLNLKQTLIFLLKKIHSFFKNFFQNNSNGQTKTLNPKNLHSESSTMSEAVGSSTANSRKPSLPNISTMFTPAHLETLGIQFENTQDIEQFFDLKLELYDFDESLMILNLIRHDLRTLDERPELLNELTDNEKTIGLLLNKVIAHDPLKVSIRESFTSNFLNYLLIKLGFAQYPLLMYSQPKYSLEFEGLKMTGKPEFSIENRSQIKCIFVDENRHLTNIKIATEFSECQIAAELTAAAYTSYASPASSSMLKDQTVFAVRVIGTRFTFYKAIFHKIYLESISSGNLDLAQRHELNVYRYPPNDETETLFGFDYSDNKHREIVLKLLIRLREQIKSV
ncbi:hypothetical protein BpHYR1_017538 [Brachionus plicatilis]|uniref:Uncharacterized protein n=1 Tax=Brachionus plicatilis TaxID=10195 RepID=A0A3M7PH05_BRAPC|nr:hypothetical protein BpHYR1_017538 [Brachionus plicatilis]